MTVNSLEIWLGTFESKATISSYKSYLKRFLLFVYTDGDIFELADRYLKERAIDKLVLKHDLDRYYAWLRETKLPKTQVLAISVIRVFLRDNNVELGEAFWNKYRRRRRGRVRTVHKDRIPTSEELRRLLSHLPTHARALFHLISATGMRIGETVGFKTSDMDLISDPPRIHLDGSITKSGEPRTVFFTAEAKESVEEWLKIKDQWLDSAYKRCVTREQYKKTLNDPRLFPFTANNAHYIWRKALKKSGLLEIDPNTKRVTMRVHTLRKRFRTQLGTVIPVDIIEVLMGHIAYMDTYRKYSEKELAENYKEGEYVLYLFAFHDTIRTVRELQRELISEKRSSDESKSRILELEAAVIEMQKQQREILDNQDEIVKKQLEERGITPTSSLPYQSEEELETSSESD